MDLYIEPFSGIAGDMLLSALCELADAWDEIIELPQKLNLPDAKIEISKLNKNGIVCRHVKIIDLNAQSLGHDHHHHHHGEDHGHTHSHNHPHRHLSDITHLIQHGQISENAQRIAIGIFQLIGESESRIHGIPLEEIHFHEVSGVDSILDIVGCAVLIDKLQIDQVYSDPICTGFGNVKTEHGVLPVPAPATADLLRGMPSYKGDEPGERATPTGVAILRFLQPNFSPPPAPVSTIAYGPGQKDFKSANVVRVSSLQEHQTLESQTVWIIETNIDDMSPEWLGSDFQTKILEAGAIDLSLSQCLMKKGRPAYLLSVITPPDTRDQVIESILENTTSIGLRYFPAQRRTLPRQKISIDTPFGTLLAKESIKPSGARYQKFEYEALKELADQHNLSIIDLIAKIRSCL